MTDGERAKWDERYRAGAYAERTHPSAFIEEWLPRLARGRALDVACGAGRNALRLAAAGFTVDAADISAVALERAATAAVDAGLTIRWIHADLERDLERALAEHAVYDLIVWIRYVNRALLPQLAARLAPGGLLLCEQHLRTDESVAGPTNPLFRLEPGELRTAAQALEVVDYREGIVADPDGRPAALARLAARMPG